MRPVNVRDHKGVIGMKRVLKECPFLIDDVERYTKDQMREVYLGVMAYFPKEDILLYKDPSFSGSQMHEIRMGFMNALSYDQVCSYASPLVSWQAMRLIRLKLRNEGLARDLMLAGAVEEGLLAAVDDGLLKKSDLKLHHRDRRVNLD